MNTIIDYGMGNVGSIQNMLRKVGEHAIVSADPKDIRSARRLILPGVGSFDAAMKRLDALDLIPLLSARVREAGVPFLGICLGMQLLTHGSEEGCLPGLGWIRARTVRFRSDGAAAGLKVPHMGWNLVSPRQGSPLFEQFSEPPRFYFVHSYHAVCDDDRIVAGTSRYGAEFVAAIVQDNVAGVQFHPEKSHRFGSTLLQNFLSWRP